MTSINFRSAPHGRLPEVENRLRNCVPFCRTYDLPQLLPTLLILTDITKTRNSVLAFPLNENIGCSAGKTPEAATVHECDDRIQCSTRFKSPIYDQHSHLLPITTVVPFDRIQAHPSCGRIYTFLGRHVVQRVVSNQELLSRADGQPVVSDQHMHLRGAVAV